MWLKLRLKISENYLIMLNKPINEAIMFFSKICFLILLSVLSACAYRPRISPIKLTPQEIIKLEEPGCLDKTEKIKYSISWINIPSGRINLETKGIEKINGCNVYHIYCDAGPNSFWSLFFKSRYLLETYVDTQTGLPLKSVRKRMPKALIEEDIAFDWAKDTAKISDGKTTKEISVTKNSHDLLSFIYYYRIKGLEPGAKYNFYVIYNGKSWPVEIQTDNIYQLKSRDGSLIQVIYVKLLSSLIAELTGGSLLEAYVSVDSKRIPIFFSIKTKMGEADANLIEK